ncbi:hypothetical protein Tco_0843167 [Tanacetum coccineum]|uniref:Uncharacterized protein n=1 Tax=Tanacetum coccineum TaxID=301880 RepID=A0ABQ5B1F6_9ASTR
MSTKVPTAAETVTTSWSFVRRIFQWRKSSCFKVFRCSTADASDKRQQQPDSTSSTSTLATTVTANGNFDLIIDGISSGLLQLNFKRKSDSLTTMKSNQIDASHGDDADNDLKNSKLKIKAQDQDHQAEEQSH